MSDKPLPVDGAVVKPETIGRTSVPGQAMRSVRAVLNKITGNNQPIEGPESLQGSAADREQTVLDPGPTQAEIDGLIALCSQRRFQEALEHGTALAERHPTAVILHNILGGVNAGLGRLDQALVCITRAVQIEPDYAEAHYNLGKALEPLGRIEEAIASYAKAVQIKPDFAEAHNNLGTVLNNLSKHDEAIASYSRALQIKPDYAQALRNLSTLKKFEIDDPQIAQMEEAISNPLVTENDRMQLSFALGKAYDDIGDAENAFRHFMAGNNLKKKELGYDIGSDRRLFSLLESIFSAIEMPTVPEAPPVTPNGKRPIFIVGMPRSGTTLVEQILASHSQVHGAGELEILNRIVRPVLDDIRQVHSGRLTAGSLEAVRGGYLTELNGIGGDKRFIIDKMPINFRWIGFIRPCGRI